MNYFLSDNGVALLVAHLYAVCFGQCGGGERERKIYAEESCAARLGNFCSYCRGEQQFAGPVAAKRNTDVPAIVAGRRFVRIGDIGNKYGQPLLVKVGHEIRPVVEKILAGEVFGKIIAGAIDVGTDGR